MFLRPALFSAATMRADSSRAEDAPRAAFATLTPHFLRMAVDQSRHLNKQANKKGKQLSVRGRLLREGRESASFGIRSESGRWATAPLALFGFTSGFTGIALLLFALAVLALLS